MFDRLEDFRVFVTVAETGSFSAAARVLQMSPSTVSKLIARMEQRMQVRAFDRSTQAAVLTREGEVYLEYIRRVLDAAADVEGLVDALGLKNITLLGNSLGGAVALGYLLGRLTR